MTHTIEIESIARLDIKPGETLVVTVEPMRSLDEVTDIRDRLKEHLPEGVEVIVKSGDIQLEVVARGTP